MKQIVLFLVAVLSLASCVKQGNNDDSGIDRRRAYRQYLKAGEEVHILWAGRNINVGTVTYGINSDDDFYVTYQITATGWVITECHMFAGPKESMPLNKPGNPKVGLFPYAAYPDNVTTFTFIVPWESLPPVDIGFTVAAHCIVKNGTQKETGWAEGESKFTDKDWGWYDPYEYDPITPENYIILYGTAFANDSLRLYHIDVTNNKAEPILAEYVGNSSETYNSAAYDPISGMFFFTKDDTTLMANNMKDTYPSYLAGTLTGFAESGTFYNGCYYYIDQSAHTINKVTFNTDWTISGESVEDVIPSSLSISDIAMSPSGDYLYMVGTQSGGSVQLISWQVSTGTFYSMPVTINADSQIAFGSDGILYAVSPGTSGSTAYTLNTSNGSATPIDDDVIIVQNSFSDLSGGPIL